MKTPTEKISDLIDSLSSKDMEIAKKLINIRDFESLRELVKSSIIIEEKRQKTDINRWRLSERFERMSHLYSEIDEYCNLLGCEAYVSEDDLDKPNEEEDNEY